MQPHIKAIIFDFGGVLLHWDPRNLYRRYFNGQTQAMEAFLEKIDFYNWNAQQDLGRPFIEGIAEHSIMHPEFAHLFQAYFEHWEDSIVGEIRGTVAILETLRKKNFPLFGLSNWSAETYPRAEKIYPFFEWFDDIVLSGEVGLNKPDPAIFTLLLDRIGFSAAECILIDDTLLNIKAAKELGFNTIHFSSPEKLYVELTRLAVL